MHLTSLKKRAFTTLIMTDSIIFLAQVYKHGAPTQLWTVKRLSINITLYEGIAIKYSVPIDGWISDVIQQLQKTSLPIIAVYATLYIDYGMITTLINVNELTVKGTCSGIAHSRKRYQVLFYMMPWGDFIDDPNIQIKWKMYISIIQLQATGSLQMLYMPWQPSCLVTCKIV